MNDSYKYRVGWICWLIIFLIAGFTDNKSQQLNSGNHNVASQINSVEKKLDTLNKIEKDSLEKSDSLRSFDVYQFTNDTLVQEVYISYVGTKQIRFLIRIINKISAHNCEYAGFAIMTNGEGTAQGRDELNNDELYGVYEYFSKGHPFFTINVEFMRGKRMTVLTKDQNDLCAPDCPLTSQGTLRRSKLSNEVQQNPIW